MGFGRVGIAAAIAMMAAGVGSIVSPQVGATIDNQINKTAKNSATVINKNSAKSNKLKVTSTCVSPSGRYQRFFITCDETEI